jgi:FkbM family methyltransferase
MLKRIQILVSRWLRANRLGILFKGTTKFRTPHTLSYQAKNHRLSFPDTQAGIHWDFINLFLDDEYGLRSITSEPRLIYDIGGNVGLFAIWCRLNFPNAKIKSFEPHSETFIYLKENAEEFHFQCFNFAVGNHNGDAYISSLTESRSNRVSKTENIGTSKISIKDFSEFVASEDLEIDLLKLDCEGAEWDIFENAAAFRKVRRIRMEYHLVDGKSLEDLKKAADRIGFEIVKLEENSGFGIAWMEALGCKS